jgi:hypothetical protein
MGQIEDEQQPSMGGEQGKERQDGPPVDPRTGRIRPGGRP